MELGNLEIKARPVVTTLGRLIAHMALDPKLHQAYLDDPEVVIAGAGLSADEQEAIRSGDWQRIVRHLGTGPRPFPEPDGDPGNPTGGETR